MLFSLYMMAGLAAGWSLSPRLTRKPYHRHHDDSKLVPNEYFVRLRDGHTLDDHFRAIGHNISEECSSFSPFKLVNGYFAEISEHLVHDFIRYDPAVEYVEHNSYIETPEHETHPEELIKRNESIDSIDGDDIDKRAKGIGFPFTWTRERASWNYAYISNAAQIHFRRNALDHFCWEGAGAGVDIYILDSGVNLAHEAFRGMASNYKNQANSPYTGGPAVDNDSHGTHVASIASKVAPGANIINTKITCKRTLRDKKGKPIDPEPNCKENVQGMINAISDITNTHLANKKSGLKGWKGSIINLSLAIYSDQTYAKEVMKKAADAGIAISTAAGNGQAGKTSANPPAPCGWKGITICTAASDSNWKFVDLSNYGKKVDIIAPGEYIFGASNKDNHLYSPKTGTSQATAHVSGAMASFISFEGLNDNTATVYELLQLNAIKPSFHGLPSGTTNLFLDTGIVSKDRTAGYPYIANSTPKSKSKAVTEDDDVAPIAGDFDISNSEGDYTSTDEQITTPSTSNGPFIVEDSVSNLNSDNILKAASSKDEKDLLTGYTAVPTGYVKVGAPVTSGTTLLEVIVSETGAFVSTSMPSNAASVTAEDVWTLSGKGSGSATSKASGPTSTHHKSTAASPKTTSSSSRAAFTGICAKSKATVTASLSSFVTTTPVAFALSDAQDAIKSYCKSAVPLKTPAAAEPSTYSYKNYKLYVSTQWSQSGQDGCADPATIPAKLSADDCSNYFDKAVNDCDKQTTSAKMGVDPFTWNAPKAGCIDFTIFGYSGSS